MSPLLDAAYRLNQVATQTRLLPKEKLLLNPPLGNE